MLLTEEELTVLMPLSKAEGAIGLYFLSSRKIFTFHCSHLHGLLCESFVYRTSVRTNKDLLSDFLTLKGYFKPLGL